MDRDPGLANPSRDLPRLVGTTVSAAREEILRRVRRGLEDVPASERPEDVSVVRGYLESEPEAGLERFVERVADYGSAVRVVGMGGIVEALSAVCRDFDVSSLVVPKDLPVDWTPSGVELILDTGLDVRELDRIGAALTGCALGIAETGTVVLDCGLRRAGGR